MVGSEWFGVVVKREEGTRKLRFKQLVDKMKWGGVECEKRG